MRTYDEIRAFIFWQMAKSGEDFARSPGVQHTKLLAVEADWIAVYLNGALRTFPYREFNVAWDLSQNLPQIRYHGGR
jgi:hypothetical protein